MNTRGTASEAGVGLICMRGDLLHALTRAQLDRPMYDAEIWVAREREEMLHAVNKARGKRSKTPIQLSLIERVERQAAGQTDYANMFAMYCAQLVFL